MICFLIYRYGYGRIEALGSARESKDCGLKINDIEHKDNGNWKCVVSGQNQYGDWVEAEGIIKIHVEFDVVVVDEFLPPPLRISPIEVSIDQKELYIQENQPVELLCSANVDVVSCTFSAPFPGYFDMSRDGLRYYIQSKK